MSRKWIQRFQRSSISRKLAVAVTASLLAGSYAVSSFAATTTYNEGLVGIVKDDKALLNDAGTTVNLDKTTNTITYDFMGNDVIFNVAEQDGIGTNTDADNKNYTFNNIGEDGTYGTLHIYQKNTGRNDFAGVTGFSADNGKVIVNSNLDITATSAYASVGIGAGNKADLVINGNVKMRKDDASSPWGIITDNVHGNVGPGGATQMPGSENYTGARWQPSAFNVGYTRGNITVNGNVDVAVRGTAVQVNAYSSEAGVNPYDLATISLLGDSIKIETPADEKDEQGNFKEAYYALASYGGTININVKDDVAIGGKTEIIGDVIALKRSDRTTKPDTYQDGRINVALTTKDSSWKGVIDNAGADHAGEINVWLSNGAQWIHEATSRTNGLDYGNMPTYSKPDYDYFDNVSYVNKLVGGTTAAASGIISQNSDIKLNIANYSGYNTIIYKHTDDGSTTAKYIGGDTIINSAAQGSGITLSTDNSGITMSDDAQVEKVLNALAGKLYYLGYIDGEDNLAGTVQIADGLTASSVSQKTAPMFFNNLTGQGGSGEVSYDTVNVAIDGNKDFSKDTHVIINADNAGVTAGVAYDPNDITDKSVQITGNEKDLAVKISSKEAKDIAGIRNHVAKDAEGNLVYKDLIVGRSNSILSKTTINDLTLKVDNSAGIAKGIDILGTANVIDADNINIDVNGTGAAYGVYSEGGYQSSNYQYANIYLRSKALNINVSGNGDTDDVYGIYAAANPELANSTNQIYLQSATTINSTGSGIVAEAGSSVYASDDGNLTVTIKENEDKAHYSLQTKDNGSISFNSMYPSSAIAINLNGNIGVTKGEAGKAGTINLASMNDKAGTINLALMNDKSAINGVIYDEFSQEHADAKTGVILKLQNGAIWNNTAYGKVADGFNGSYVNSFTGGTSDEYDGTRYTKISYIEQNDSNDITIGNYSGNTMVLYSHINDGTNASDYSAGNINITKAASGSKIIIATDNSGIDTENKAKTNAVLNQLANKLYYLAYANNERNLTGEAQISSGLTSSWKKYNIGNITFDSTTGQGSVKEQAETTYPESQTGTAFSTAITGKLYTDEEYRQNGVLHDEGNYEFTKDSTITLTGTSAAGAIYAVDKNILVNAADSKLTLNNTTLMASADRSAGIYQDGSSNLTVNAKQLDINAKYNNRTEGIHYTGTGSMTINGDTNITAHGTGYTLGIYAAGGGTLTINGNLTMKGEDGGFGVTNQGGMTGGNAHYSVSGIYSGQNMYTGTVPKVVVNGNVDLAVDGTGILANYGGSSVTINGGGTVKVNEAANQPHYALMAEEEGVLSMNVNTKDGSALNNDVNLYGNVFATTKGTVNLALATAKSSLNGTAFSSENGTLNLALQNGAVWNNASYGQYGGSSIVDNFTGGSDAAHAGNIFQKDSRNLTINNYSGFTNVYYAHTGDGTTADDYAAGDTIITKAAEGSGISLITDNSGITMADNATVNSALNALAGKLTYSSFATGEKNLTGYVKIADGLTASSVAMKSGAISFDESSGKGSYNASAEPEVQTSFTTTITGVAAEDEYKTSGVYQEDGSYKFTKDSTITAGADPAIKTTDNVNINAEGTELTLKTTGGTLIEAVNLKKDLSIKADNINMVMDGSSAYKLINFYNNDANAKHSMTFDGDVTVSGDVNGATGTVINNKGGKVEVTGLFTAKDLLNQGIGAANSAAIVSATVQGSAKMAGQVYLNGGVDIATEGTALSADGGTASNDRVQITVSGGKIIAGTGTAKENYAIYARSGDVFLNMNDDHTAAAGNKVEMTGNVTVQQGVSYGNKSTYTATADIGLNTADSVWTGVAYDGYANNTRMGYYFDVNLWLSDGATWNNEVVGKAASGFKGSSLENFTGGSDAAHAGNIFQKDSRNLTINNYSGFANVYYAHEDNGEAAENYAAGDTVIKGAAEGSVVSLITDNTDVAMDNADSVANVLNALAGKLTYSNFATGEKNLTGYVKIADGLTASSKSLQVGDITFTETGKGSYVKEVPQQKTEFTTTITGDTAADTEYADNIKDSKYVFGADTSVKAAGEAAVDVKQALTIDAGSNKLTLTAKSGDFTGVSTAFNQNVAGTTKITAGELIIGASSDSDFYDRSGLVVKNGTVDITAANTTIYAHNLLGSVAYGVYALNNGSSVDIHGDLKLVADDNGVTHGLWAEDTSDWNGKASIINVDGKADISVAKGSAVTAIRSGSTVNIGGGSITIGKADDKEFYALKADGGNINLNMNADRTAAGSNDVTLKGNLSAYGAMTYANFDFDTPDSTINLGLSGDASSWTGVAFSKDCGSASWPFKGIINLYLNNGATWNNEAWGKTNTNFDGSHITKFVGGSDEAHAGNIFQRDSRNITIDNYSGNTNIFYAHEGNGEAAENYAAGDTIITSAADGSVVSLITDNTGIAMDNEDSVAKVLNALAGKLTYSNFTKDEKSLTGYAKIAGGLTASSKVLKTEDIQFSTETGKGSTGAGTVTPPEEQDKDTFTEAITGANQSAYVQAGVQKDDLTYNFTNDETTIKINQMTRKEVDPDWEGSYIISGAAVQTGADVKNLVINAEGKVLHLNVGLDDKTTPPDANAGILNNRIPLRGIDNSTAGSVTSVTAGTLDIHIDNTYSRKTSSGNPLIGAGSAAGIYTSSTGDKAETKIEGNTNIWAHGYNNVYGIMASGNAAVSVDGDLTMAKDGENWALDNVINGNNTTSLGESSWRNIAGINAKGSNASVSVSGATTIAAHGSGVIAQDGGMVELGAADIEIMNNKDEDGYAFYAVGSALGTVNVGGEGKTVSIKGNAGLFGKQGQQFTSDSKQSVINLKLMDADSEWTGVAYKHFSDEEQAAGYTGALNLTLSNGAVWNNEQYGYVYGENEWEDYQFTGSSIASFVGGDSEANAGNIFQKDSNNLTIDSYSGNTNIFYAHTGNGEAASDYAAGDTIIKSAATGSVVSLITDNTGISIDNEGSVKNVLNALAGKLTYSNFAAGEKNLTGYVKIADGLTASSKALQVGDITFDGSTGKGGYVDPIPEHQTGTEFDQAITGVAEKDKLYVANGVLKNDVYTFEKSSTISTTGEAINVANKDVVINAADDQELQLASKGQGAVLASTLNVQQAGSVAITAPQLKVTMNAANSTAGITSGIQIGMMDSHVNGTNSLKIQGDTTIDVTGKTSVMGIYSMTDSQSIFDGNLTIKVNNTTADTAATGALGHYHTNGIYAGFYNSSVTVTGNVDITVNGTGIQANKGGVVKVLGGGSVKINATDKADQYALIAEAADVSMNVAFDEAGKVIGSAGSKVNIEGNLGVLDKSYGAAPNDDTPSVINLGLTTADSTLTGVAYNEYLETNSTKGSGAINLWLQNGATWNNEAWGAVKTTYSGSKVASFVGGSDAAHAGNIFQKDENNLTIDSYSGNTNIFYAHTGNGEAASDYAAGDTIIKSAAEGSTVSLITDSTDVAMDNEYSVKNVLNALAGKLTYSNFVNGEENLTGYVKIADGLTASSKSMQAGDISFSKDDGKGSFKDGTLNPGFTYPDEQPEDKKDLSQGITGDAEKDYGFKQDGILKDNGNYVFTQDPTTIKVDEGAAVSAGIRDIEIDTSKAKLVLAGASEGIKADGHNVNVKGSTEISGETAISANNGDVTLNGITNIKGENVAISAENGANVSIGGGAAAISGDFNANGGNITIDTDKTTSEINGNMNVANGGSINIALNEQNSKLAGGYDIEDGSSLNLTIKNHATWNVGSMAGSGLNIIGGETEGATGFIIMPSASSAATQSLRAASDKLDIASLTGWETIIYDHENSGADVSDYTGSDTVIRKAAAGSGVIMSTDNSGIDMKDKTAVEATLKALAQKVTYSDHEANASNLTGKVQIADGLTASSASKNIGDMSWAADGKGQYVDDSVNWDNGGKDDDTPTNKITEGDYETFVMKGVRSAATTSMHTWRDNMQDTYTGADLADADGIFAKALGGKTSSDVKGLKDSNTYYGVQVGYDKAAKSGWHTGVAFDYRNGDSNYLLGGKGDNQMYSLGVYGVKNFADNSFFRVAAKVGRVENEYDVYNEIRSLKLHGDYKANAYGLTMEYGKTFGNDEKYITPKAQLTWAQVGSKSYSAYTEKGARMDVDQDSYSSFVGRLGFEAGVKSEKGRVYAGLFATHEFNGDIGASYFANDGDKKYTSFDGKDSWMELKLGGTYDFSEVAHFYADIAKDFGGDFERKWKLNAGIRFEF